MKTMTTFAALAAAMSLCACATPYQEASFWSDGGVSAKQVASDTLIVTSTGNLYTKPELVTQYALRRAAETAIAAGNDWIMPVDSKDRSKATTIATAYGTGWGGLGLGTPLVRPGESMTVKMGKNPKPDAAMDAREVVAFATKSDRR